MGSEEDGEAQEDEEEEEESLDQRWAGLEVRLNEELPSMSSTEALATVTRVIKLLSQSRTIRHSSSCCQVRDLYLLGRTMRQICSVLRKSVSQGAVDHVVVAVERVLGNSLFMRGVTHSYFIICHR